MNCGYRCPEHNAAIGGEPGSQHTLGKAADVTLYSAAGAPLTVMQMYLCAMKVPVFAAGGVGVYPEQRFIHVDVRGTMARWGKVGGKYVTAAAALQIPQSAPSRNI